MAVAGIDQQNIVEITEGKTSKKPPLGPEAHREKALNMIFRHFA